MTNIDREGRTDLHYAARDGDLAAVKKLFAQGANVNLQDRRGWSPLHFAAPARSPELSGYLLESMVRSSIRRILSGRHCLRGRPSIQGEKVL